MTGTLAQGGFRIRVNNVPFDDGNRRNVAGGEFEIVVDVASFKGILIRLGGTTVDQLIPQEGLKVADACQGTVGGVTHSNNIVKTKAKVTVQSMTPGEYPLDITVVVNNSGGSSVYYYSSMTVVVPETIYDVVNGEPDLSTIKTAIDSIGFESEFRSPYRSARTLFAPTNDALSSLDAKFLAVNWIHHLEHLVRYHTVAGSFLREDIADGQSLSTIEDDEPEPITASVMADSVSFSGTAFAGSQLVGDSNFSTENGVVHKVTNVFFPSALAMTLWDKAVAFSPPLLISQLFVTAGLESELKAEDRTLFSFTSLGYSELSQDVRQELADEPERLRGLLLDHICEGVYPTELLTDGLELTTVSQKNLEISVVGSGMFAQWFVEGTLLSIQNGVASNGIVHMIDAVLLDDDGLSSPTAAPTLVPEKRRCCPSGFSGLRPFSECESFYACSGGVVMGPVEACGASFLFDEGAQACVTSSELISCQVDACSSGDVLPPKKEPLSAESKDDSVKLYNDNERGNLKRKRQLQGKKSLRGM